MHRKRYFPDILCRA